MRETNPQRFYEIVGLGAEEIDSVLGCDAKAAEAFIAHTVRDRRLDTDWRSRFRQLGAEPEFQKVQVATLTPFFRAAIGLADQFRLRSEQGLAQMFDWVFIRGPRIPKKPSDEIEEQIQKFREEQRREPDEQDRMKLIAGVLADSLPANLPGLESVRSRIRYFGDPMKKQQSWVSIAGGAWLTAEGLSQHVSSCLETRREVLWELYQGTGAAPSEAEIRAMAHRKRSCPAAPGATGRRRAEAEIYLSVRQAPQGQKSLVTNDFL